MTFYVLNRGLGFFGIKNNFWILISSLLLTIALPLIMMIDRFLHNFFTESLYFLAMLWFGFLFLSFSYLIVLEAVNLFYPAFNSLGLGIIFFAIMILMVGYATYNAGQVSVKEVSIKDFGATLRAVQITDLHIGSLRNHDYLEKIVSKVNSLKPELVFITGDLVDDSGSLTNESFRALKKLKAPTYFVMGNHEYYNNFSKVEKLLEGNGVIVLRNEVVELKKINLIGIDYTENSKVVKKELNKTKINNSKPSILLNHVPVGAEVAKAKGVKLMLSGHTHAGQIFPFSLLVRLTYSKIKGLYSENGFYTYVNPGTGTWGPPMRLGSKKEITLLKLE